MECGRPVSDRSRSPCAASGQGLEACLGDVVAVDAVQRCDVQRNAGILRERLEPLAEQLGVHVTDLCCRKRHVPDQERAPGNVDAARVSVSSIAR